MTCSATILADSIGHDAPRLVTLAAVYPRMIHPEVLRHRPLSHSVGSSRAVPVSRMLWRVIEDPAEPVEWGSNQPGMVAGAALKPFRRTIVRAAWHGAKWVALGAAWTASAAGAHKQIANRIIEPWTHTVEIITGTDWDDFFRLRIHEHADPTIRAFAVAVRAAFDASTPQLLSPEDWHLPLVSADEKRNFHSDVLRRVSAARCARASYLNHDKSQPVIGRDLALAGRLMSEGHWSPFEHQGRPDFCVPTRGWAAPQFHGNLRGYLQDRKLREASKWHP